MSIRYTERLADAGIEPSVGSVGDSYDNALAETVIGLFKTEVIYRRGPWRSISSVLNKPITLSALGYTTPAAYAATLKPQRAPALRHPESSAPMPVATAALTRNHQPRIPVTPE